MSIHEIAIPKFNIELHDNNGNGSYELAHDAVTINGMSLTGAKAAAFFKAMKCDPENADLQGLAEELSVQIENWFAPQVKQHKGKTSFEPAHVSASHMAAPLGKAQQFASFLQQHPMISILEPEYKYANHDGRCQFGCSWIDGFELSPAVYFAVQLPAAMGNAVMTYPMGEIEPSQQKVSSLFSYGLEAVCFGEEDIEAFHSDGMGSPLHVVQNGDRMESLHGKALKDGHCNE